VCRIVPSCPWVFCGGQRRDPGLVGILWGQTACPTAANLAPTVSGGRGKANPGHSVAITGHSVAIKGATQMVTSDRNSYPGPKPALEHADRMLRETGPETAGLWPNGVKLSLHRCKIATWRGQGSR
jgi:hypothetical protein